MIIYDICQDFSIDKDLYYLFTVENGKNQITAFINKPYVYVNGQKMTWDSNNILVNKKVYVPVSAIDKLPDKEKIEEVINQ